MSHFSSYLQRSDTDVVIHVQLIAPLIKLCACMCVCAVVCVFMSVLTTGEVGGGRWGGHGHICILKATLHTSNCMIHLFITSPYMSISKNIQTKVSQMCNPFVIGDQFLRL